MVHFVYVSSSKNSKKNRFLQSPFPQHLMLSFRQRWFLFHSEGNITSVGHSYNHCQCSCTAFSKLTCSLPDASVCQAALACSLPHAASPLQTCNTPYLRHLSLLQRQPLDLKWTLRRTNYLIKTFDELSVWICYWRSRSKESDGL